MDDRHIQAERRHGPADRRAGWGSGAGASTYGGLAGGTPRDERDEFNPDYRRWREQQMRDFDRDYDTWRQERYQKFSQEFNQWRAARNADANPSNASSTSAPFPKQD